jgi:hypothetical protein
MSDRKRLVSTLWLASSLALLASVLVAPVRTWGDVTVSSRLDCLRFDYLLPQAQPTTLLSAPVAPDAVLRVNDIPSEEEEQDWTDGLDEPRVTFLLPYSFREIADLQSIAPRLVLSLYPLRC